MIKQLSIKSMEWSSDLVGYILLLDDNRIVQVQFAQNTDKLDANYGKWYPHIDKQNDYGLDITSEEEEQIYNYINNNIAIQEKTKALMI